MKEIGLISENFGTTQSTITAKYKPSFRLEICAFDFSMKLNVSIKE